MRELPFSAADERFPLVGRQEQIEAFERAYDGGERLITLWGTGGVGKSRLLRFLGDRFAGSEKERHEILFCDLTEASGELDIVRAVGTALRLQRADHATDKDGTAVAQALARSAHPLVLLDGFDHVVRYAEKTVGLWMRGAPRARFIVSTRQPLKLPREQRIEIPPLSEEAAVNLFTEAAREMGVSSVSPTTARQIVRCLDGLPLAIELATARLEVLGPQELLDRLQNPLEVLQRPRDEREDRHGTLAATVAWSWELLDDDEQRTLVACSVFRGGFSTRFAELVIGAELQELRVLECLEALRLKSLLQTKPTPGEGLRLRPYNAVRIFASHHLDETGRREALERRHAEVVLSELDSSSGSDDTDFFQEGLEMLVAESENLLAIHERFIEREPELALRAALLLHPLLLLRGPFDCHMALIGNIDDSVMASLSRPLRLRLLLARGELFRVRDRLDDARPLLDEAIALAHAQGDDALRAKALRLLGAVDRTQGCFRDALDRHREALQQSRVLSDERSEAICLGEIGATLSALGRFKEARKHHRMALELHRRLGDRRFEGIQLSYLGVATHRLGHIVEARDVHIDALAIHRDLGNRRYEGAELSHLGFVHHQLGEHEVARESYERALGVCREVGDRGLEAIVLCYLGNLETDAGRLESASSHLHDALLHFERAGDEPRLALVSLSLGFYHFAADELDEALEALHVASRCASPAQAWIRAAAFAHAAVLSERIGRMDEAHEERETALEHNESIENPHQRFAVELLCKQTRLERSRGLAEAKQRSSDVRRALLWIGDSSSPTTLEVGPGSTWFRFGTVEADLSRRRTLRLVLEALVRNRLEGPEEGLQWHELFAAGWPGERISGDAALQRVYTAVWTLRKLGLKEILHTGEEGYRVDPNVPVVRKHEELVPSDA